MFVCFKLCLYCANLLLCAPLKAKESWAVSPVNTQIPTWITCSRCEFVYFLQYAQIQKYKQLYTQIYKLPPELHAPDRHSDLQKFSTWTMKSLNFLRWQSHSQGLLSICSCWGQICQIFYAPDKYFRQTNMSKRSCWGQIFFNIYNIWGSRNPERYKFQIWAAPIINLLKLVTFYKMFRGGNFHHRHSEIWFSNYKVNLELKACTKSQTKDFCRFDTWSHKINYKRP